MESVIIFHGKHIHNFTRGLVVAGTMMRHFVYVHSSSGKHLLAGLKHNVFYYVNMVRSVFVCAFCAPTVKVEDGNTHLTNRIRMVVFQKLKAMDTFCRNHK